MIRAELSRLSERIERLEHSDFALNKADYDRTMRDLRSDNPGLSLFPE